MSVAAILGGMFGIRHLNETSREARRSEFDKMLADFGPRWQKGADQWALSAVVAPHAAPDSLVHDSYLCKSGYMKGSRRIQPFPTQREGITGTSSIPNFVGNTNSYGIKTECPKQCRPKNHQDWKFC